MTHKCNAACSWKATPDLLRSLGFDVPTKRSDDTQLRKWECDKAFLDAKHDAANAGKLRTCTRTPSAAPYAS